MALRRKREEEGEMLSPEIVRPDGGFGGGYAGFTPGDFEDDAPVKKERRGLRRRKAEVEDEFADAFADSSAAPLEGSAPLTQFDFLEGRWVYTQKVSRTRRVVSGVSGLLVLAILAVGTLGFLGASQAARETKEERENFTAAEAELGTLGGFNGLSTETVIAHLTGRRTEILAAVSGEPAFTPVIAQITQPVPGIQLQSVTFQAGPAGAVDAAGAPATGGQTVIITVQGRGFDSVIAWIKATEERMPALENENTVPSGSPQGTFSITTTATVSAGVVSDRVTRLSTELAIPGQEAPAAGGTPAAPPAGGTPTPTGASQ